MKICLIAVNSKFIHTSPAVDSLRAFAKAAGISPEVLSFTVNQPEEEILGRIYEHDADVYAFSVYIWNCETVYRLAEDLHAVREEAEIWFGGPEVTWNAESILNRLPFVRGIMRGEGEETFTELAGKVYAAEEPCLSAMETVRGITCRSESGEICATPDRPPMDLNDLVFPYDGTEADPNRIYYYESSRGCPFGCTYCLSSVDRDLRFKSTEKVFVELGWFLKERVRQVKFVDRTFNVKPERSIAVWKYLKERDNGITNFHFEICGELLTEEELELLETLRPGQVQFEIGVQTANRETLKAIHRMRDEEKLQRNVARLIKAHNIHIHLDLIAGLPFEPFESFRESFNAVYHMHPLQLQLGFLKILSGTPMETFAKEYRFKSRTHAPYEILSNEWIGYEELLCLKRIEEMTEVYYNSRQFEKTIEVLEEEMRLQGKTPFDLFERLALFYIKKGYDRMDHARMRRYEILLEFILENGWEREKYVPLLLYDALSRERLKHWPDWAGSTEKPKGFDYDRRDPLTGNALFEPRKED